MNVHFGGPVDLDRTLTPDPKADMDWISATLAAVKDGGSGCLRLHRPSPTAAFSRIDSLHAGYDAAAKAVRRHGFSPVLRPAGGRLAIYDSGALVIDLVAPHDRQKADPMTRFALFCDALKAALSDLGFPAEIGELPHEYCPGKYSLHVGGRKVVGVAQRMTRAGYHLGAIVVVGPATAARAAMSEAYPALGLMLDPNTVGSLAELRPETRHDDVERKVLERLGVLVELRSGYPAA